MSLPQVLSSTSQRRLLLSAPVYLHQDALWALRNLLQVLTVCLVSHTEDGVGLSYFPVAVIKHRDPGDLQKKEFILACSS